MDFIERRFRRNRRSFLKDPDGFTGRQAEAEEKRQKKDRRIHCMHCRAPYVSGPTSSKTCVCRTAALRTPGYV